MSLRAVSVKVNSQNPIRVESINTGPTINVKVSDQQDYKVSVAKPTQIKYLRELTDVSAMNPVDNDVIVYNSAINKYETRQITIADVTIDNIDGGIF